MAWPRARAVLVWAALAAALAVPLAVAATSPLLAWREPIYIAAGLAGVVALGLLLVQPLLPDGHLPGLGIRAGRRWHAWVGGALVAAVTVHVAALWVTSPPDVVDALLFRSPTAFSVWGVVAMWAVFASALLAATRRRMRLVLWRLCHMALAAVIVVGSVVHAVLIDGTMGTLSKAALCALVLAAGARAIAGRPLLSDIRRIAPRAGRGAAEPVPAEGRRKR
jgi:hypothetical protein